MRRPKMRSAPHGEAKMASAFMRASYRRRPTVSVAGGNAGAQRLLERRDARVERVDLLAQANELLVGRREDDGWRRRGSADRRKRHRPLGPKRPGHGKDE